jgi:hypothetical protein
VLAESWRLPPGRPFCGTLQPSPATRRRWGRGTGLVLWNSCSRRWARLECGRRLRTRTFMETCCWRRRRRRQPEGFQRRKQQRPRSQLPDPDPGGGTGRTQRGPWLPRSSRRVRGLGKRGGAVGARWVPGTEAAAAGGAPSAGLPTASVPAPEPRASCGPAGAARLCSLSPRHPASGFGLRCPGPAPRVGVRSVLCRGRARVGGAGALGPSGQS